MEDLSGSMSELASLLQAEDGAAEEDEDMMEVMVLPRLGPGNVMVDQSPLQPQLQKNKECKSNVIDATLTFGPVF